MENDCLAATGSALNLPIAGAGLVVVLVGILLVVIGRHRHRRAPAALGLIVLVFALSSGLTNIRPEFAHAANAQCPGGQTDSGMVDTAPDTAPAPDVPPVPDPVAAGDLAISITSSETEEVNCPDGAPYVTAVATLTITVTNVSAEPSIGTPIIVRTLKTSVASLTPESAAVWSVNTPDIAYFILESNEVIAPGASATPIVMRVGIVSPGEADPDEARFFIFESTLDASSEGVANQANNIAQTSIQLVCPV